MVEIAKAVSYDSDVLIMDEPTSAITDKEVDRLFEIIAQLKSENKAIVYITHKMNEVFTIADDISVFRDGQQVGSDRASAFDQNKLISLMVGRELTHMFPKGHAEIGEVVLVGPRSGARGRVQGRLLRPPPGRDPGHRRADRRGPDQRGGTIFGVTPATRG